MSNLEEIKIPYSGSVENVEITEWLVSEGDTVDAGALLAEVSTDKADTELESPAAGRIVRFLVPAGTEVKVGTAVALLAPTGADEQAVAADLAAYQPGSGSGSPASS